MPSLRLTLYPQALLPPVTPTSPRRRVSGVRPYAANCENGRNARSELPKMTRKISMQGNGIGFRFRPN